MTTFREFVAGVDSILKVVVKFSAGIAAVIVFVMMFPITVDVVLRYIFNSPLQGTYQLAEFMMVWAVYFAVAYVQSQRGHINIEVATDWLPPRVRLALDAFGRLLGLSIFSIITWQTGAAAWHTWRIGDYTMGLVEWPLWPAKAAVAFGAGLLSLQLLFDLIGDAIRLFGSPVDSPAEGR